MLKSRRRWSFSRTKFGIVRMPQLKMLQNVLKPKALIRSLSVFKGLTSTLPPQDTETQRIELTCICRKLSLKTIYKSDGERDRPLISGTTTVGSNNNHTANAPRATTKATTEMKWHVTHGTVRPGTWLPFRFGAQLLNRFLWRQAVILIETDLVHKVTKV